MNASSIEEALPAMKPEGGAGGGGGWVQQGSYKYEQLILPLKLNSWLDQK